MGSVLDSPSPESLSPADGEAELGPSQRVRRYIESRFLRDAQAIGGRLPTARSLANELDVSPRTVLNVYRELGSRGLISTQVGNGTFVTDVLRDAGAVRHLGVVMSQPTYVGSSAWTNLTYGGMMLGASAQTPTVTLHPVNINHDAPPASYEKWARQVQVDGFVFFPIGGLEGVAQACEALGKPAVFLNPPAEDTTTNFVSPDYYGGSRKLGQVWRKLAKREVWFYYAGDLEASVSTRLRLAGLAAGLGPAVGTTTRLRVISTHTWSETDGLTAMRQALKDGATPDAIYCAGDYNAIGALRALQEVGQSVPKDVSIVGGTGYDLLETPYPTLTRFCQPFQEMGVGLIRMLSERLNHSGQPAPARVLPISFVGGQTTSAEENMLLGLAGCH